MKAGLLRWSYCSFSGLQSLFAGLGILLLVSGCGNSNPGSTGGGGTTVVPSVASISPAKVLAGASPVTLTVNGSGFLSTSIVQLGGLAESTAYVSGTQLTATVPATQVSTGGLLAVAVVNGTTTSTGAAISLEVDNPAPTLTSLSPRSVVAGAGSTNVAVTGTNFVPSTVLAVNGSTRTTTYTSATQATVALTAADLASAGFLAFTAVNPAPGGGTSADVLLSVTMPVATPVITSLSPASIDAGSADTTLTVLGTGFVLGSVVNWNGAPLQTELFTYFNGSSSATELVATVPAADLAAVGTGTVTVQTPGASPSVSNAASVSVINPTAPTLTSISPNFGALATATQVTVQGTGFVNTTTVLVNGVAVPTTVANSGSLTANIPASSLATPENMNLTVNTPAPGGGTSSPAVFTVYLPINANDIVFNSADSLLYASIVVSGGNAPANTVVGIDPTTGNVTRQIFVGSNPNKLALSSDGKQLFVGLDGSAAVAQVDLTHGKVVSQFSLGGGQGLYNPPLTALYLAAVPGSPNSVAVAHASGSLTGGGGVTIFDSGVARTNSFTGGSGPLSFGSSAATLYVAGYAVNELTVGATGVTGSTTLANLSVQSTWAQFDEGNLYLSTGQVFNGTSGALAGTFYSGTNTVASGPVVSDSTLGRAFIATSSFGSNSTSVEVFDEASYNLLGSTALNGAGQSGYGASFEKLVRWGQDGLAINASPGPFTGQSQLFIIQSSQVKDLTGSPADLSVTLSAPKTSATGTPATLVATVENTGPNAAQGVAASITVDPSLILGSITPSTGTCGTGASFNCDLGALASGASATITVHATPTQAGPVATLLSAASVSYDPVATNNQVSANTTITGATYGALPSIAAISPNLVQAGTADFQLTVTGSGFNAGSTVNLGGAALATTYVSASQLTATVPAAQAAAYGWAPVTVSNPSPGGGVSSALPLTMYSQVNVPATALLFDPYAQLLYATIPSTSTTIAGNSVVSINPVTSTVGTPVMIGSQPTVMAETTDGNYLYISLAGANSVAQFDLLTQTLTNTIPIAATDLFFSGSFAPSWMAAMPGTDFTLAVSQPGEGGAFGIVDISGNTGTFRSKPSRIYEGDNPIFADASHIFAYDSTTSGAEFYRYSIDATGVTEIDGTTLLGMGGYGGRIQYAGGLVFGAGGGIINPVTTPPSQVATLNLTDLSGSGSEPAGGGFLADPSLGKDFLLLESSGGSSAFGITRFDLATYLPEASLQMPAGASAPLQAGTILRWGQDGLALLSTQQDYSTGQTTASVLLLHGPFVAPQELATQTAASLTASSPSTLAHGSGNTVLTLTGTNFLPGVAVTWKGKYRTTTRVDATHVTVDIPASDVASAGSAALVAINPGASGSNSLSLTIN